MRRKYGFVVLNYNNFDDSCVCLKSILGLSSYNYEIALVDNCSTDESFTRLKEEFSCNGKIHFLQSGKNGGYSFGNNYGINFFKKKDIKNIVIATNDTQILNKNFIELLDQIDFDNIGMIGPKISTPTGLLQNPVHQKISFLYFLNIFLYEPLAILRERLYFYLPGILSMRLKRKVLQKQKNRSSFVYMIHGSFFILTENYFRHYQGLDERLFMYSEEDLLSYNCLLKDLKVLYFSKLEVLHKAGSTVNEVEKTMNFSFRKSNILKSRKELIRILRIRKVIKKVFLKFRKNSK